MKISASAPSITKAMDAAIEEIELHVTGGMRDATAGLKSELRQQVIDAGLGQRLANSWRGETYPAGRPSMSPAGYIWSNAPTIIDGFVRGATVHPVNGANYLWIPTRNVPRTRKRRMTPSEVDSHFNAEFAIVKGKGGSLLAYMDVVSGLTRGFRRDTKGRRAQGRAAKPVLMFVLRKTVKQPKLLNLQGPADRWGARVPELIEQRWR